MAHTNPLSCPQCHTPFPADFDTDLEEWSCVRCHAPLKLVGEDWVVAEGDHEHSHGDEHYEEPIRRRPTRHEDDTHSPRPRRRRHDEHDESHEAPPTEGGNVPTWIIVVAAGALLLLLGWLLLG